MLVLNGQDRGHGRMNEGLEVFLMFTGYTITVARITEYYTNRRVRSGRLTYCVLVVGSLQMAP